MNIPHKGSYKEFSFRLVSAMKRAGHAESRSSSGISVRTLADVMDVSEQICRRYLRGDALPDYAKVIKIAQFLKVSPGWLLFGDQNDVLIAENNTLHIDEELLHYALEKSHVLYLQASDNSGDFPDFVLSLLKDISAIDANRDTLKKIIDLAVGSICSFEERKHKKIV